MPTIRKPRSGNPHPTNKLPHLHDTDVQQFRARKNKRRHLWNGGWNNPTARAFADGRNASIEPCGEAEMQQSEGRK